MVLDVVVIEKGTFLKDNPLKDFMSFLISRTLKKREGFFFNEKTYDIYIHEISYRLELDFYEGHHCLRALIFF